ncbi:hypothetical protein [Mesorhizobium cantuariense]|uniref:Uncharacterized protein n=1 Tax=Mesorhizobium cantuariense TaxID=1300275 RepID=A0ABV7MKJ1_9HYPH
MADKQAVEQLKTQAPAGMPVEKRPPSLAMRDFLAKTALSRMRRFPVAN